MQFITVLLIDQKKLPSFQISVSKMLQTSSLPEILHQGSRLPNLSKIYSAQKKRSFYAVAVISLPGLASRVLTENEDTKTVTNICKLLTVP